MARSRSPKGTANGKPRPRPASLGLWPGGGALDAFDKAVSDPLFRCRPSAPLELLLTTFGLCFGIPTFSLCCLTPLLMLAADPASLPLCGWAALWAVALVALVSQTAGATPALDKWLPRGHHAHNAFKGWELYIVVLHTAVGQLGASAAGAGAGAGAAAGAAAAMFYVTGWIFTVCVCIVTKTFAGRTRPTAYDVSLLEHKRMVAIDEMIANAGQATESFVSGDAAAAAVFVASLLLRADASTGLNCVATPRSADAVGAAILLLGITGRVFLRCHHVIDVLCGAGVGLLATMHWLEPVLQATAAASFALFGGGIGSADDWSSHFLMVAHAWLLLQVVMEVCVLLRQPGHWWSCLRETPPWLAEDPMWRHGKLFRNSWRNCLRAYPTCAAGWWLCSFYQNSQ